MVSQVSRRRHKVVNVMDLEYKMKAERCLVYRVVPEFERVAGKGLALDESPLGSVLEPESESDVEEDAE